MVANAVYSSNGLCEKSLGQNFLNSKAARDIVRAAEPSVGDTVLE